MSQRLKVRRRPRGFTLIEMLIALAIISLISLMLFSGLRTGSRAWETVETVSTRIGDLRLADGFLRRTLSQTVPAEVVFDGQPRPVFAGDAERIELVAPLSTHVGLSGLYILRLQVEEQANGRRALVLTRWYMHPEVLEGGDDYPAWEPLEEEGIAGASDYASNMDAAGGAFGRTVLLDDVALFEIAYYGESEGETELDWYEEWLEQPRPPTLIQIRLATEAQSWPDLIIQIPSE